MLASALIGGWQRQLAQDQFADALAVGVRSRRHVFQQLPNRAGSVPNRSGVLPGRRRLRSPLSVRVATPRLAKLLLCRHVVVSLLIWSFLPLPRRTLTITVSARVRVCHWASHPRLLLLDRRGFLIEVFSLEGLAGVALDVADVGAGRTHYAGLGKPGVGLLPRTGQWRSVPRGSWCWCSPGVRAGSSIGWVWFRRGAGNSLPPLLG